MLDLIFRCKWASVLIISAIIMACLFFKAEKKNLDLDIKRNAFNIFKMVGGLYIALVSIAQVIVDFVNSKTTMPSEVLGFAFALGLIESYAGYRLVKVDFKEVRDYIPNLNGLNTVVVHSKDEHESTTPPKAASKKVSTT